jgi:hypothetical protein
LGSVSLFSSIRKESGLEGHLETHHSVLGSAIRPEGHFETHLFIEEPKDEAVL